MVKEKSKNNIVLVNEKGFITEAVNANIFIIKNNIIYTPKLSDGCIDGIMRGNIIDIIQKHLDYKVEIKSIKISELLSCDEMFLTNSIIGVQHVSKYKNTNYSKKIISEIKSLLVSSINSLMDLQES